jgi:hypothetical protein
MVKANFPPVSFSPKYHRVILLIIFFLFITIASVFIFRISQGSILGRQQNQTANDPSPPSFLSAISDRNGEVPLFWFSPQPETSEIIYHQDGMLKGFYVLPPWRENRVGVRMSALSVPFCLLKSKIYVSHQGAEFDTGYDFKAPFFVTVHPDSEGSPQNDFLDSVAASALGDDTLSDGEWVGVEHNLLMTDSIFWIIFHWNKDTPLSPLVGEDSLPNVGNSLWGKRTFSHFEWHSCEFNLMIHAQILSNSDKASDVDSFKVYRSSDSTMLIDQSNLIATVPGFQFQYMDSDVVEDQTYFYRLTSVSSPVESQGSNRTQATPRREAELVSDRDEFSVSLSSGEQIFDSLTLVNSGGLPLRFEAHLDMEHADWMGGSDRFGYTWTDDDRQAGLEFVWIDIEDTGVLIGDRGDDNEDYGFFGLGFPFPFYENTFDSIRIASDGWLSFSPLIPCYTDSFLCWANKCLPYLWGPYNLLAPFWDDLKLTDSSAIYFYSDTDSAIISFLNFYHYGQAGRGPYSFQTILTPNGEITFQYLEIDDSLYCATVGIQNQDGTAGLEVFCELGPPCNQNDLHDSLSIKIRPSWAKVDSKNGWIQPGDSKILNLTFDRLTYPQGIYHANLYIDSWDKNHQLEMKVIPLTLCIDTTTSVDWTDGVKPEAIMLFQNYPNPFNPLTRIQFTVGSTQTKAAVGGLRTAESTPFTAHSSIPTTLKIYNILGQIVRTLVDEPKQPGNYEVTWDGKDDKGKDVASGIYFCKLTVGSYQKIRKMVLLK